MPVVDYISVYMSVHPDMMQSSVWKLYHVYARGLSVLVTYRLFGCKITLLYALNWISRRWWSFSTFSDVLASFINVINIPKLRSQLTKFDRIASLLTFSALVNTISCLQAFRGDDKYTHLFFSFNATKKWKVHNKINNTKIFKKKEFKS